MAPFIRPGQTIIGLDTHVLVCHLAQDEPKQAARATRLIEEKLSVFEPGFISRVVLVELCWVLKRLAAPAQTNCWQRWTTC